MTTLRNEILPVRELKKRFVTDKYTTFWGHETTGSIEKTVIAKKGFRRVVGYRIEDVPNSYYNGSASYYWAWDCTAYTDFNGVQYALERASESQSTGTVSVKLFT